MINLLASAIDPKNNYTAILVIIGLYLFSLWVLFCFWVFIDSQKRFKNFAISTVFFFLVLILNLPALFFYLIVRPEKEDENVFYLNHEESGMGGVNIPIVNFMGKDGVEMSLQIKINRPVSSEDHDMNVSVNWDSSKQDFKKEESDKSDKKSFVEMQKDEKKSSSTKKVLSDLRGKIRDKFKNIKASRAKKAETPKSETPKETEKKEESNKPEIVEKPSTEA